MKSPKRLPMRLWIKEKLDEGTYSPQMKWVNRDEGKFQVLWRHGSRTDWRYDRDMTVFREWAAYTGVFDVNRSDGSELAALCKRWKTNFRCALNSLPEIELIRHESEGRGENARKVYIMRDDKATKNRNRKLKAKEARKQRERKTSSSSSSLSFSSSPELLSEDQEIIDIVDQMSDDMSLSPYSTTVDTDDLLEIKELMEKDRALQAIYGVFNPIGVF